MAQFREWKKLRETVGSMEEDSIWDLFEEMKSRGMGEDQILGIVTSFLSSRQLGEAFQDHVHRHLSYQTR